MLIKDRRSVQEALNDYDAFLAKFEAKKTTDDCYTPRDVYAAVADHVFDHYGLPDDTPIVRPFYPGGDYENENYPEGCVVIDNPPFSIFSKILDFYTKQNIKFFIFAPALTALGTIARRPGVTLVNSFTEVIYANGASVRTSFATNLSPELAVQCAPELWAKLRSLQPRTNNKVITRPDCTLGVKELAHLARRDYALPREQMTTKASKDIRDNAFGGVVLLSDQARDEMLYTLACPGSKATAGAVEPEVVTLPLTEEDLAEIAKLNKK